MNDEQREFLRDLRTANPALKNVNDDLALDLALGAAGRNQAACEAWDLREDDQSGWKSAARGLASEVASRALGPRRGSRMETEDENERAMQMSDGEFAAHTFKKCRVRL